MFTKLEQRSWIKIELTRCRGTQECFQGPRGTCGQVALSKLTVAGWFKGSGKTGMPSGTTPYRTTPRGEQKSSTPCFSVGC